MRILRLLKSKLLLGAVIGAALVFAGLAADAYMSTNAFCGSCHLHPHAERSWKRSTHADNPSGMAVRCVECHLPPSGIDHFLEKARLGIRDLYGALFKEFDERHWEEKSRLEHAVTFTFKEACTRCHQNLFPVGLSREGDEAHLHYDRESENLRCINCHLHVGHYHEEEAYDPTANLAGEAEIYLEPAVVEGFVDFTERIPGTSVSFDMAALPGGAFMMGSPEDEDYRRDDEGPCREVTVSPFWMARVEVTWDEYEAFYRATATEGRTDTRKVPDDVDAITGATPPYGNPGQGWGKGGRPAITMTHHAAMTYCRWLSRVTGKRYRLPTEAEWEYACRGGTDSAYFFEGEPKDFSEEGFWNSLFGADTEEIGRYAVYAGNAKGRTQPPECVAPNPFGLKNMSGNVAELCLDWYAPDTYERYADGVKDPRGPDSGEERVVRGGSFKDDAAELRSAARGHTHTAAWLMTDPQIPKSIWWYSDCMHVGFRVVCDYDRN
jgi:formylglycine-generating enzyme required for sulfatase activity/nitrate/TMAO reductase-like tetraheme cytochrome c subunit